MGAVDQRVAREKVRHGVVDHFRMCHGAHVTQIVKLKQHRVRCLPHAHWESGMSSVLLETRLMCRTIATSGESCVSVPLQAIGACDG